MFTRAPFERARPGDDNESEDDEDAISVTSAFALTYRVEWRKAVTLPIGNQQLMFDHFRRRLGV
jgi:hypothetical protein